MDDLVEKFWDISIHSLHTEGDAQVLFDSRQWSISIHSLHTEGDSGILDWMDDLVISIHSLHTEGDLEWFEFQSLLQDFNPLPPHGGRLRSGAPLMGAADISIHSLHTEGDCKTAQESVFHFAYPCTILQKRMQKTTFCTRKNGFFRKKGEKFGAKPSASFCAPMIRTDTFPLNFSHRISGSSMSMVSFAPICSTFD